MKKSGVYKITNTVTNKIYIGSSINIEKRWNRHKTELKNNCHCNTYLQKSYNKYGEDSFLYEILTLCEEKDCISKEQYYIDNLKPKYNLCQIAGSCLGIKRTEAQNKAKSLLLKGRKTPKDVLEKRALNRKLNPIKIKHKEGQTEKIRLKVIKTVYQYDLNGVFIKEWESATVVTKYFKCGVSTISNVCCGKKPSAFGFIWLYQNDITEVYKRLERIKKSKPIKQIDQYDLEGNFIKSFKSFEDVDKEFNIKNTNSKIYKSFYNPNRSVFGYKWKKILL